MKVRVRDHAIGAVLAVIIVCGMWLVWLKMQAPKVSRTDLELVERQFHRVCNLAKIPQDVEAGLRAPVDEDAEMKNFLNYMTYKSIKSILTNIVETCAEHTHKETW